MKWVTSKQKMPLSLHFQMLLTFELNAFIDSNHLKQALQLATFTNPAWRTDTENSALVPKIIYLNWLSFNWFASIIP